MSKKTQSVTNGNNYKKQKNSQVIEIKKIKMDRKIKYQNKSVTTQLQIKYTKYIIHNY